MSGSPLGSEPVVYEVRIGRHLDERWDGWFGDLALRRELDGTTTMRGPVADQAELHGILVKIRDLGIVLLSLRTIGETGEGVRSGR